MSSSHPALSRVRRRCLGACAPASGEAGQPQANGEIKLGDSYRGETLFSTNCAGCHGQSGKGGASGRGSPGAAIPLPVAKAQIDNGGGTMPAGLVKGQDEADVLAYLATILKNP